MLKLEGELKEWRTKMSIWPEPVVDKFWANVMTWAIHHGVLESNTKHLVVWFNSSTPEVSWNLVEGDYRMSGAYVPNGDHGIMEQWMRHRATPADIRYNTVDWSKVNWGSHS